MLPREDILTHGLTNRGDLGETPPVKVMQPKEKRNKKYLNDADNLTRTLSRGQSHADYLTRTLSRADNLTQTISRRHFYAESFTRTILRRHFHADSFTRTILREHFHADNLAWKTHCTTITNDSLHVLSILPNSAAMSSRRCKTLHPQ